MPQNIRLFLLSEKEAALYLGVSVSTMRRWRRTKSGPPLFRFGGVLRYRCDDLDTFVRNHINTGK
jgi:Helix-turn-helix domain